MNYEKINEFVGQMLGSPALKNTPPSESEDAVMAIIRGKEGKLRETFAAAEYYPDMSWDAVKSEIFKSIEQRTSSAIQPFLKRVVFENIQNLVDCPKPDITQREKLLSLVSKLTARYHTRKTYGKILSFIETGLPPALVYKIYENKKSSYRGLVRTDGAGLKTPEAAMDYIYTAFMLLPVYEITLPARIIMPSQYGETGGGVMSLQDMEHNSILSQNFILKIKDIILKEVPDFSSDFINILSSVFYLAEDKEPAFESQLLKTLYRLSQDYKAVRKDKGADSFAMSWLNVARVNYKFYGFDYTLIDELYKITLEEDL